MSIESTESIKVCLKALMEFHETASRDKNRSEDSRAGHALQVKMIRRRLETPSVMDQGGTDESFDWRQFCEDQIKKLSHL
jgi:hypothetical protein